MDQYRRNYVQAEQVARNVLLSRKNHFLDNAAMTAIPLDGNAYIPHITTWFALNGFRHKADEGSTERSVIAATNNWLHSATASGSSLVYAIKKQDDHLMILYGSNTPDFHTFTDMLPECLYEEIHPDSGMWNCSGILIGTFKANRLADAVGSVSVRDCLVSCISMPLHDSEVQSKLSSNRKLISQLDKYKSFQRFFGNTSRRVQEVPVEAVVRAIAALKEENDLLEKNMGRGFVRAAVRICAQNERDYNILISRIKGCIEYECNEQNGFEPIRRFRIANRCASWDACLAIPCVSFQSSFGVEHAHLLTAQTIDSVSSFCTPPLRSYPGYVIKNYHIDENAHDVFGATHTVSGNCIDIGGAQQPAKIPLSSLQAHAFITGRTTTGKTTTVKKVLVELHKQGIPFLVIEAAKKEYARLLEHVPEIKVYTSGVDGIPLRINPLQPEDGTLIENHVQAVVRAITAMNGGEHPIPEAYEGVLKQTYQKFCWYYGSMAYQDPQKPFPTFKDVLDNVDEYIQKHGQYGPEVRKNLTAALKIRTEHQSSGALGGLFNSPQGLTAKELLATPAVIELADFSEQSAAFLMNIILFRIQCYLSKQPESKELSRVIVVEEAHNVFRKTLCEDSPRALNNNSFDKMLAEVRASGTGMIISDQRPSIMSSGVIANTAVKIVHGLTELDDRQVVGNAINLTPFQVQKLYEFVPGECIVALGGHYGVQHVRVSALPSRGASNAACLSCTSRFRCRKTAVLAMMNEMDEAKLHHHIAKIQSNPYNTAVLARNITDMLTDLNVTASAATKCCLLGEILATHSPMSEHESRVIITSYSNYIRR